MRTLFLLPLAFALSQASAIAAPQTQQGDPSLSEIQVRGVMPAAAKLQPQQIDEIKGVYALDNGSALKITNVQRRLFAQLGQRNLTELVPVGDNRFVSLDQRMTVEYRPVAFGDEIVLTYPADLNLASSELVTVRLAQN
jgi:hypothetical protein